MIKTSKTKKLSPALFGFAAAGAAGIVHADQPAIQNIGEPYKYSGGQEGGVLYSQLTSASGNGAPDQNFEAAYNAYDSQAADDFTIPAGQTWNINEIFTVGTSSTGGNNDSVDIAFYANNGGVPAAAPISSFLGVVGTGATDHTIPVNLSLGPGTYWIAQVTNQNFGTSGQHFWSNRTVQSGNQSVWRNAGGGFATGCTDWTAQTTCGVGGGTNPDFLFEVRGTVVPEPSAAFLATILLGFFANKVRSFFAKKG